MPLKNWIIKAFPTETFHCNNIHLLRVVVCQNECNYKARKSLTLIHLYCLNNNTHRKRKILRLRKTPFGRVASLFLLKSLYKVNLHKKDGVATDSTFCEQIVLRIPEPRSKDYPSILHSTYTYWWYIPTPPSSRNFFGTFCTSTLSWLHYTTRFFALHEFARQACINISYLILHPGMHNIVMCCRLENCSLIPYLIHFVGKYTIITSNVVLLGPLLCAMQSIFSAKLCLATVHAVLLASPIITHVLLHKRWVEREREIAE